jgi:prevent-host-death family protein
MNWHLQDAKNNFSKLVQQAIKEGPQTVTLRGQPTAVLMSVKEYERLTKARSTFADFILDGPIIDDEMLEVINRRDKEPSRKAIEF